MVKFTLSKQIYILYILVGVLFALLLTGLTMHLYFYLQKYISTQNCVSKQATKPLSDTNERCIVIAPNASTQVTNSPHSQDRDMRVLKDPLYPALNRSEFDVHNSIVSAIDEKQLYQSSHHFNDRYRLVAYVTNTSNDEKDAGGNRWKLMAKQRDRNNADFFLVPVDRNYDMKVMLDNNIVVGERLRDTYTIPKQLVFNSPLLNTTPYEVVELPMTDFTQPYN